MGSIGLAAKYRPQAFSELVGQRLSARVFERMVETDQVPNGLLLSGPSGTGKTSLARVLAKALDSPDVIEVDAASTGGVDAIRGLIETLRYGHEGKHRVVIVDEAHAVTRDGFNALLKTLEEPPNGTVFVLASTEPEKIPETVKSRLVEFEFRRITPADVLDRLIFVADAEGIEMSQEILVDISQRADGNLRTALGVLEQVLLAGIKNREEYEEIVGAHDSGPRLLAAIVLGSRDRAFAILDEELQVVASPATIWSQLVRVMRDVLVLHGGGDLEFVGASLNVRQQLAARTDTERIYAAARTLWDLKARVRFSDDPRSSLELAIMLMLDTFTAGENRSSVQTQPDTPQAAAPRKLTLAEMKERLS